MADYEVFSPWAETDPVALKGISPRLGDLKGKKIGLFFNEKRAGQPILEALSALLKQRSPTTEISIFGRTKPGCIADLDAGFKQELEDWVKGLDGVIAAVGD